MGKQIFRKAALERLASPEQLDQLARVTTPVGWVSLLALGLLVFSVVIWSVYGKISTVARGGGILIKTGGVVSVVAPVAGSISHVYVEEGDLVKKGQIIGRMAQPKLLDEIRMAKNALAELESRERQFAGFGTENLLLKTKVLEKERENLEKNIAVAQERSKWLEEKTSVQKELLREGLITRQTLLDTKTRQNDVLADIESNRGELKNLEARLQELANEKEQQLMTGQESVNEAKRRLGLQEAELEFSSRIISTYTGNVVEVRAFNGQVVNAGEPIVSLELTGQNIQDLQALIYMPPDQGKQIKKGMLARVTPQTVKREEFGYMLGLVTRVAEFPASNQGMVRVLKNQVLVNQFSKDGAPISVFVDFIPDPDTPSSYKWSSSLGPAFKIDSGTLCQGSVEVRSQPPISLVIPYLKKQMGLD